MRGRAARRVASAITKISWLIPHESPGMAPMPTKRLAAPPSSGPTSSGHLPPRGGEGRASPQSEARGTGSTRGFFPSPRLGRCTLFQIHAKHFQISGLFLQIFPNNPLAVLWEISGLQGRQGPFVFAPNFMRRSSSRDPRPGPSARRGGRRATKRSVA